MKAFNYQDVMNAVINNQMIVKGASVIENDDTKVFFISEVMGTVITIKDAAGNIVISPIAASFSFNPMPLRLDSGFEITGTNLSVVYGFIVIDN